MHVLTLGGEVHNDWERETWIRLHFLQPVSVNHPELWLGPVGANASELGRRRNVAQRGGG